MRNFLSKFDYQIDFMGQRRIAMAFSLLTTIISLVSIAFQGMNYGLDFTGGTLIEVRYSQSIELKEVRTRLHHHGFSDAVVQHFGTTQDVMIRLGIHQDMDNKALSSKVLSILQQGGQEVHVRRVEFVGAQVGKELIEDGLLAVLYTSIGILIYVALRYEFRFALGAVLALLHDPLLILGVFSLFRIEFDLTIIAAVLAIMGYSINDTIVVFDRIRDNFLKLRKQASTVDVMNASINQTLSRTIMTSVTTLIVVIILFFTGGDLIRGFSLALIIGIMVGTYSSIYVASALSLALGVSRADLLPVQKEGDIKSL